MIKNVKKKLKNCKKSLKAQKGEIFLKNGGTNGGQRNAFHIRRRLLYKRIRHSQHYGHHDRKTRVHALLRRHGLGPLHLQLALFGLFPPSRKRGAGLSAYVRRSDSFCVWKLFVPEGQLAEAQF